MFSFEKLFEKEWYFRKYLKILSILSQEQIAENALLEHRVKKQYEEVFHKKLHLRSPKSLNEKLIWLSLYWRHPLKTMCADKVKVRDYVRQKGLSEILTPILGIYESSDDIHVEELPSCFVLKCNHGCAYNIVVKDKEKTDFTLVKQQLDDWLAETYKGNVSEIHYKDISPHLILCEEYLCRNGQDELVDYKIHCLNGQPEYIQVCHDRDERGVAHRASYSLDWKPLHYFTEPECVMEKPKSLEHMVEYAKVLSQDFPYVRVDFYEVDEKPVLSELTFTPFGNMIYWVKEDVMEMLGAKLILPSPYKV